MGVDGDFAEHYRLGFILESLRHEDGEAFSDAEKTEVYAIAVTEVCRKLEEAYVSAISETKFRFAADFFLWQHHGAGKFHLLLALILTSLTTLPPKQPTRAATSPSSTWKLVYGEGVKWHARWCCIACAEKEEATKPQKVLG